MNTNKKTARIVGVLFIIATVLGALSLFVFLEPSLDDPDYLTNVSANENQIIIGAVLSLIMVFAIAMIPVMMFPIFKKHNEALALGYVVFRVLEVVTGIALVIIYLLLLTLSQEYVNAGSPDASHFQTSGTLLLQADDWINYVMTIVFSLGALMFYYLWYQSKLIPRFLSVWGLIGATLTLPVGLLCMFGLITELSALGLILALPLALNEIFLAVWLIVKGFNSSAIASESVNA
ncbi:MAG: DUF4386 domain-containing protein [Dehalococcoidia bacterium]|nr:DUF4386 domain-containing protein [Dehalococcoidia bacterium]